MDDLVGVSVCFLYNLLYLFSSRVWNSDCSPSRLWGEGVLAEGCPLGPLTGSVADLVTVNADE